MNIPASCATQFLSKAARQPRQRGVKAAADDLYTSKCGPVTIKLYSWTLKCGFHIISVCEEVFFFGFSDF